MAKLTKAQAKLHEKAVKLLQCKELSEADTRFVFEHHHWQCCPLRGYQRQGIHQRHGRGAIRRAQLRRLRGGGGRPSVC